MRINAAAMPRSWRTTWPGTFSVERPTYQFAEFIERCSRAPPAMVSTWPRSVPFGNCQAIKEHPPARYFVLFYP